MLSGWMLNDTYSYYNIQLPLTSDGGFTALTAPHDIIKNNTYKGASEHLYYIDEVSDDTLDKLIREGDALQLASYYIDGISTNIVKDDQDIPYAATIYLRRYGGREELAKEI